MNFNVEAESSEVESQFGAPKLKQSIIVFQTASWMLEDGKGKFEVVRLGWSCLINQ